MALTEETKVEYITGSRSIHEIEGTLAFYNYKGNHFRLFWTFADALAFTKGEDVPVIADFESEDDLIVFLSDCETCSVCEEVLFPDSECYEDGDSGDSCCTECCFYDESDDVYRKGTIESYLSSLKHEYEANANLVAENKAMADYLENQLGFSQDNISDIAYGSTKLYCVHVVCYKRLETYRVFTKIEDAHASFVSLCKEWYSTEGLEEFKKTSKHNTEIEYYENYFDSSAYQDACDNARVAWELLN